jgi:hypothetical protein
MQKKRITVTVRRDTLRAVEKQVKRGGARSVSAWVDAAMEEKAKLEDLAALLEEMNAEGEPTSREDEKWARSVLGL